MFRIHESQILYKINYPNIKKINTDAIKILFLGLSFDF